MWTREKKNKNQAIQRLNRDEAGDMSLWIAVFAALAVVTTADPAIESALNAVAQMKRTERLAKLSALGLKSAPAPLNN